MYEPQGLIIMIFPQNDGYFELCGFHFFSLKIVYSWKECTALYCQALVEIPGTTYGHLIIERNDSCVQNQN